MDKKWIISIIVLILVAVFAVTVASMNLSKDDSMYQVSLLQSFMHGEYDGVVSVEELKSHGDIGLGTFNGVNGEMIVLDGVVYQAQADGSIHVISSGETIPFATVTNFDEDSHISKLSEKTFVNLTNRLTKEIEKFGKNHIYVIKIDGNYSNITVRSVEKQEKPYREFTEVAATDQRVFNYTNQEGTIVAVYFPDYMAELNMPGWHLHFISGDKTKGGHVLNVTVSNAQAGIDEITEFKMIVPKRDSFNNMNLTEDMSAKINKVE